jgi:CheY-like chemotaxis protein
MTKMLDAPTVLIVEDDEPSLRLVTHILKKESLNLVTTRDGMSAWDLLRESPDRFSAVLLDWMLPHLDGIEVIRRMKQHPVLKTVPVIFQTARASRRDIAMGLEAGAYYYLPKPYSKNVLSAIVRTAVSDHGNHRALLDEVRQTTRTLALMTRGRFEFQSLEEAKGVATLVATGCPDPAKTVIGLSELCINAVEHGNLGITYEEKSCLSGHEEWLAEVERRMALPANAAKAAILEFERSADSLRFTIKDQGRGFDWKRFVKVSPERAGDTHGRGIAMAASISFDSLEYRGAGNEACATILCGPSSRLTAVESACVERST